VKNPTGEWNEECRIPLRDYIQTTIDGNIWVGPLEYLKQQGYSLYSSAGQHIKTATTKPLQLGVIDRSAQQSDGNYKIVVRYPECTYAITVPRQIPDVISRDLAGNLYVIQRLVDSVKSGTPDVETIQHCRVIRYNFCGKETGRLDLPEDTFEIIGKDSTVGIRERILSEYGQPVVAHHSDVYTWKRTPDKYSILKWTWVDDTNVITGPDAPTNFSVMPSTTGLYLTWSASPCDPGCVTGYEVSRATTSGGMTTTVATVDKGVIKYNDTTATAGTTYYYKVRAVAGSEYSSYTIEVSGKR